MPIRRPDKSFNVLPKSNIERGNERQFNKNWDNAFKKKIRIIDTDDIIDTENYPDDEQ